MERIETIIVGAGQAGLSTSYFLTHQGHEHLVLEQGSTPAPVWRNERWDSFTLVTPKLAFSIPDAGIEEKNRNEFMTLEEVVNFFDDYVDRNNLPVRTNIKVTSVEAADHTGFLVKTSSKQYHADNVVIATGFYQKPKIPVAIDVPADIYQIHSSQYRNPENIPEGAVLIIGSAQSGCQLAEELNENNRKVYLCTCKAGRAQRRYRGKDIIEWLDIIGLFNLTPDQLPPGTPKFYGIPHISGKKGGRTLNLHQFSKDGIVLLGHLRGIRGTSVSISPDMHENLEFADQFDFHSLNEIDSYIQANGLDIPKEEIPVLRYGFEQPIIEDLDLRKEGIKTIIWANGYTWDFSMVKLPVRDRDSFPIQTGGVTNYKGLYFVGQPWMPNERTGFLLGVGQHAQFIASNILDIKVKSKEQQVS